MAVALVGEGDGGGRRWSGGEGVDTGGWGMEAAVAGSTYQNTVEAGSSGGCWVGVGRRRGRIRAAVNIVVVVVAATAAMATRSCPPKPAAAAPEGGDRQICRRPSRRRLPSRRIWRRGGRHRLPSLSRASRSGGGKALPPSTPLHLHAVRRHHASLPAPPLSPLPDLTRWRRRPCQAGAVPEKEAPEYWLSVLQYLYMKLVCVPSCRAVHI
uniref:Uncharacterized protein n=1 Tax=Oryza nivara TaxID=4536 RepID=A0A0E0IVH6_ORYNI